MHFWGFVVSVMLFTLGGGVLDYGVLAGGFVFEAISLGIGLHSLQKAKGPRTLRQYWIESRESTLPTRRAGGHRGDPLAGARRRRHLAEPADGQRVLGRWRLRGDWISPHWCRRAARRRELFPPHRGARPRRTEMAIRRIVGDDEAVERLVELRTMHIGPHQIVVALGVHFKSGLSVTEVEKAIRRIEDAITGLPGDRTSPTLITVEPTRAGRAR